MSRQEPMSRLAQENIIPLNEKAKPLKEEQLKSYVQNSKMAGL